MLDFIADIAIPFLIVLTVLVFIHELGHYLTARWCGVKVEVFSIGFGPELFGWRDRRGTRWRVSALPLGGYVKMLGGEQSLTGPEDMRNDPAMQEMLDKHGLTYEQYRAQAFPHKRLWQRMAIVAGGPIANFILAAVVFAGLFMFVGAPTTAPIAGTVVQDSAAEEAGMQPGDRILEVDGSEIDTFEELQRHIHINDGSPVVLLIDRGGNQVELTVTPRIVERTDPLGNVTRVAQLGITQTVSAAEPLGPIDAVGAGIAETYNLSVMTLRAVGQIIIGSRSTDDVGGVVRIAQMSGQVADLGIITMINFIALLSISLGLINLFPIPVLDGGHLLFYAIEGIRGRPLGQRAIELSMGFGLVVIIGLFVTTTVIDLMRFDGIVSFFQNLTG